MLELRQNKSLDTKIFMYAYKHKDNEKDLLKLSKQLKIRLSEDLMSSLRQLEEEKFVSPSKRVMLPIANKCISTNLPIFYRILHVLETMNYPFSNNYLYNQMSKTFLPQSVPQVMAS